MNYRLPFVPIISSFPDFLLAFAFLVTWIEPNALGENMLSYLSLIMLLEFIIIHSSAFMGFVIFGTKSKLKKIVFLLGLALFYNVFVGIFSLIQGEFWPIIAFWGLVANRMLSVLLGSSTDGSDAIKMGGMWAVSVFCYVTSVFIVMLLPLPQLGVTDAMIAEMNGKMGGLWFTEPYKVLAFGFLYFMEIALFELLINKWKQKVNDPNSMLQQTTK